MSGAPKPDITIYTDGACSGNPGPGGWGAILISGEHRKELSGGERETTNNRMTFDDRLMLLSGHRMSFCTPIAHM